MVVELILFISTASAWVLMNAVLGWRKRRQLTRSLEALGWSQTSPWRTAKRGWINPYRTMLEARFTRDGLDLSVEVFHRQTFASLLIEGSVDRPAKPLQVFETQRLVPGLDEPTELSGDPVFDYEIRVAGPRHFVTALLDHRLRRLLREGQIFLSRNRMRFPLRVDETNPLAGTLQSHIELFDKLRVDEADLPQRYLRNLRDDPQAGVRKRNLEALLDRPAFRASPEASLALERGLADPSPQVRLAAAVRSGDPGLSEVEALLHNAVSPDEVREEALLHLLETLGADRRHSLLERAFGSDDIAWLRGALRALRETDRAFISPTLALCRPGSPAEVEALAALGTLRASGEDVQGRLLRYIERLESHPEPVGLAAIRSLALIGGPIVLAALTDLVRNDPDAPRGRAAARAIASIRTRFPAGGGGSLSLASSDASSGQLTLGQGGELTEVED